ncbi:PREDICTED: zinc finger protein 32-like [Ceratosolen solmsi marchali]|uniref:Zinc finger protein 32-like n=1 Tax=Ceratosolen solmsi marchali TaxID=326594 RepID=A0AAJ6YQ10_9HYME|nr:PREDICTED: zinc finger protein 32-like [Ceratosolen solmsi marchali]
MQSHVARYHCGEYTSANVTRRRVLQLPAIISGRRLPNAQLYTGYACHYCTFVAATVASINSHTGREHQGQRQPIKEVPVTEYDCDQCDYKSRNRRNMQLHVKRCHTAQANAEGMFACHACSYETLSRMGLKRHISIKHNKSRRDINAKENYHECEQCDFKCLNGKTMDWHKRQHSAPPNAEDDGNSYFCNDCDFSTWTKGQLYLHIKRKHRDAEGNSRENEPEQPDHLFACEQCDYTSKNKHVMKVHVIRKHTNDYNHECEICGKKYKIKADLTNHIRFQHREQPIICDVCGKTCRNSNLLYLHQKFAHYKPEFECPTCHRRMVSQANLDDHILKQHEQREDAVCEECGKKFTKQARLKIHMRIHTGVKPYTCKVCLKAFARRNGLRQHLLIHTGQRPYICDICGKSFTQKTGLICHRKSHPGSHPPLPRVTIDHVLSDLLNEEC